mmetsp:Transcript_90945/g.283349  ORF Transcript_90945/g.283349 Transcript_90945/m.283349 type:complete len:231 (-) Transcript_90945:261-953(-)
MLDLRTWRLLQDCALRSPGSSLNPQLALVGLASAELLPSLVRLGNHLHGGRLVQGLLVEAESVQWLAVRRLVPAEPLADATDDPGALGLNISDIVELLCKSIILADRNELPVQLTIVDHRQHAKNLHGLHGPLLQHNGADLHDVNGIVVPRALGLGMLDVGVLPCLRQHAVVPEDWPMVVTELSLLDVLGDRVARLLDGHLHLRLCHLRDLDHGIEHAILTGVQGYVVPR